MCIELFKDRLQQALDMRGMSAAELSRRCGVNKSGICRYLKGTVEPKPSAVKSVAEALGVSPAWLLGFDGEPKSVEIPPITKSEYNPIDYSKLNTSNKIRIKSYYQALLDTQEDIE